VAEKRPKTVGVAPASGGRTGLALGNAGGRPRPARPAHGLRAEAVSANGPSENQDLAAANLDGRRIARRAQTRDRS
jgi:hypothetical protein